jgi:hypothetical protein
MDPSLGVWVRHSDERAGSEGTATRSSGNHLPASERRQRGSAAPAWNGRVGPSLRTRLPPVREQPRAGETGRSASPPAASCRSTGTT